jgi:hypothetical protein
MPGLPQKIRQDQWLKKHVKISSTHYPESGSWIAWSVVFGAQGKAQRRAMAIPFQGVETQPCAAKFRIMEAGKPGGACKFDNKALLAPIAGYLPHAQPPEGLARQPSIPR